MSRAWVHLVAFLVASLVAMLALFLIGPSVQQCLGLGGCPTDAWLASLSPVDRFLLDHREVVPWIDLGIGVLVFLVIEGVALLVRRRGVVG